MQDKAYLRRIKKANYGKWYLNPGAFEKKNKRLDKELTRHNNEWLKLLIRRSWDTATQFYKLYTFKLYYLEMSIRSLVETVIYLDNFLNVDLYS